MNRYLIFFTALFFLGIAFPNRGAAARTKSKHTLTSLEKQSDWNKRFGAGIILGEPSGLTVKYWLDQRAAVDGGIEFSLGNFVQFNVDYLYRFPQAFGHSTPFVASLFPYIGAGGVLLISSGANAAKGLYFSSASASTGFGIRIPLGIEWKVPDPTLGVFVEIAPGIGLIPSTYAIFQGGVGARYYF